LRVVRLKSASPAITPFVMRSGTSAFSQTCSATHRPLRRDTANAIVGPPLPPTIRVCPYTIGVIEFVSLPLTNGRSHKSVPVAASTLTSRPWVIVITWRMPPKSATTGDPYPGPNPGPSPPQVHFTSPLTRS
jgi:hypothetical protein